MSSQKFTRWLQNFSSVTFSFFEEWFAQGSVVCLFLLLILSCWILFLCFFKSKNELWSSCSMSTFVCLFSRFLFLCSTTKKLARLISTSKLFSFLPSQLAGENSDFFEASNSVELFLQFFQDDKELSFKHFYSHYFYLWQQNWLPVETWAGGKSRLLFTINSLQA